MAASLPLNLEPGTYFNYHGSMTTFELGNYITKALNSQTLKQNKYDTLASSKDAIILDARLNHTIYGDMYNSGLAQYYFKNHQPPNIII